MHLRLIFCACLFNIALPNQALPEEDRLKISLVGLDRYSFIEMRDRPLCNITLSGRIETGDADLLASFIDSNFEPQPPGNEGWIACLDSNGGNFAEGIRIGEVFNQHFFATRVRNGDTCLSACAVAFLYGTFPLWDDRTNMRILDSGGRIGWHAPSLRVEGETTYSAVLRDVYDEALSDIADLIGSAGSALRTGQEEVLPRELLRSMLEVGSEDFHYLQTVGQLLQYDILLSRVDFGFPASYAATTSWRAWVCHNALLSLGLDYDTDDSNMRFQYIHTRIRHWGIPEVPPGWEEFHIADYWTNACHSRYNSDEHYFDVNTYVTGRQTGSTTLQLFALLPPSTRISDLHR